MIMKIGKRNPSKFIKALFARRHYVSFINIFSVCYDPLGCLKRYFLGLGIYPTKIALRTPLNKIEPEIYSYYDMLTINEIFFRLDYKVKNDIKVVVDIGSNIGISALYFLTRNNHCRCYLFEPDPDNVVKLIKNLRNFKDRYILEECAVASVSGIKKFGKDPTGRCGGLNRKTGNYIEVRCCRVNDILKKIFEHEDKIDILKIDAEGDEIDILRKIDKNFLDKIKNIYFEIDCSINLDPHFSFYPEIFIHRRYGETIGLANKKMK